LIGAGPRVTRPTASNCEIPPYAFQGDTKVRIGEGATA
jgi:ubiquinol-cytochrome c reductase iron-sulfur subunit